MTTYIEKHTINTRDTLNVDHNNRETYQHVKFMNPYNIYRGIFTSNVYKIEDTITGKTYDVILSSGIAVISGETSQVAIVNANQIKNVLDENTVNEYDAIPSLKLLSAIDSKQKEDLDELARNAVMLSGGNNVSGYNFIEDLHALSTATDVLSARSIDSADISAEKIFVSNFNNIIADGKGLSSILSSMDSNVSALADELRAADLVLNDKIINVSAELLSSLELSSQTLETKIQDTADVLEELVTLSVDQLEKTISTTDLSIRTDLKLSVDTINDNINNLANDLHGNYYTASEINGISSSLTAQLVGDENSTSANNDIIGAKKYADQLAAQASTDSKQYTDDRLLDYYTKNDTDERIKTLAANYLAKEDGKPFQNIEDLIDATQTSALYCGGNNHAPEKNDYAVVLSAVNYQISGVWRYVYESDDEWNPNSWQPQYVIENVNYAALANKPRINDHELSSGLFNAKGKDYDLVDNTTTINGKTLSADIVLNAADVSAIVNGQGTVLSNNIADNAVTAEKLANDAVGTNQLRNDSVTSGKIATNAITAEKIVDGTITAQKLAPGVVNDGVLSISLNDKFINTFSANTSSNISIDINEEDPIFNNWKNTDFIDTVENLQTEISSKIWIDDKIDNTVSGSSDLSVIKLSREEYNQIVAKSAADNIDLSANTLYIIDADDIDVYGQLIKNLADAVDLSDAVNLKQLNSAVENIPLSNYYTQSETSSAIQLSSAINSKVPTTLTINGKALSTAIILTPEDIGAKPIQLSVDNPGLSGTSTTFIATIQQDEYGVITATRKKIGSATAKSTGITKILSSLNESDSDLSTNAVAANVIKTEINAVSDLAYHAKEIADDAFNTAAVADTKATEAFNTAGAADAKAVNAYNRTVDISADLSSKIWIDDKIDNTVSGSSDLSVIKLSREEYETIVVDAATSGIELSANTLYIIDADDIDVYGQQIKNLADAVDLSDAVNLKQLSSAMQNATDELQIHIDNTNNPHNVTKTQILSAQGMIELSDIATDISSAISSKVEKISVTANRSIALLSSNGELIDSKKTISDFVLKNSSTVIIGSNAGDSSKATAVAIGNSAIANNVDTIAIGHNSKADGDRSIAIGASSATNERTHAYANYSVAIGPAAVTSAASAVQIGRGVNTLSSSLQFRNTTIVNNDGKIPSKNLDAEFLPILKSITWSDLTALCSNKTLVPGQQYRITDYVATTNGNQSSRTANHSFDIIVVADSISSLNESAHAILHDGDLDDDIVDGNIRTKYFANCKLEAWKIWYCIDNDTTRFAWANTTNGKGVIYRMIDEFNNDCPFDFKGLQIKRVEDSQERWYFTFDNGAYNGTDASLTKNFNVFDNVIGEYRVAGVCTLGGNIIKGIYNIGNVIGVDCYKNVFGGACKWNRIGDNCNTNEFGSNCDSNVLGSTCYANKFESYCSSNTFGNDCFYNTFDNSCRANALGSSCYSNTFGNGCYANAFGNGCYANTFGNSCSCNTFDSECSSNTFGNSCSYNTFGNGCYANTFGSSCYSNTFGNSCSSNTFGSSCYSNTFDSECSSNTFGNSCSYNTFGNSCYTIKFGTASTVKSYCCYIRIESGNQYIYLNPTGYTSDELFYQNVEIKSGINNTTTYKTIDDPNVGQTFHTTYKPADSREISK